MFAIVSTRSVIEVRNKKGLQLPLQCGFIPDSQRMFDIHHSDNDSFDSVHPRELELGTASIASLIYLIDKYGL